MRRARGRATSDGGGGQRGRGGDRARSAAGCACWSASPTTMTRPSAAKLADRLWNLRVFDDEAGVMNRSAADIGAELLVVSQFTLYGDTAKRSPPELDRRRPARARRTARRGARRRAAPARGDRRHRPVPRRDAGHPRQRRPRHVAPRALIGGRDVDVVRCGCRRRLGALGCEAHPSGGDARRATNRRTRGRGRR